jgi:cytochrome c peroxidase
MMPPLRAATLVAGFAVLVAACDDIVVSPDVSTDVGALSEQYIDAWLAVDLRERSFDGRIEERLVERLGRPIHQERAELGRLLFFDPIMGLNGDNSCSGCHGPNSAFNDGNSIAIGVGNNGVVGPGRRGPHNQRRAPTILNTVFYPSLMWDSRFESLSLDPFDNSKGFAFPEPEGLSLSAMEHLLGAQAFTPVVSSIEMAGFEFGDDHDAMRAEIVSKVAQTGEYQSRFADSFEDIAEGAAIGYQHLAAAIAEFEFTLVRADAPLDRYARGETDALTYDEKAGARLFFDEANCAECHIVRGYANQMFSDFEAHVLAVPQVVPVFGNKPFDGAGDEDYGLEQHTGRSADRYKFRTSPLRNVAYQPTFMHNGAYLCLDEAVRHHLQVRDMLKGFSPEGLEEGLQGQPGPYAAMLDRTQLLILEPQILSELEISQLVLFVGKSLTDPDAHPDRLRSLIPTSVPSGLPVHEFQYGTARGNCSI